VLLVLLIGTLFYVRSWLNTYLQSEEFRQLLGRVTSKQLSARCEYAPFHYSATKIHAEAFKAKGTAKAAFSELELDNIRIAINLGALLNKALEIDDVTIDHLQVSLGHTGAPPVPESEIGAVEEQPAKQQPAAISKPGWLSPKLDLRKVVVNDTNVLWGEKTTQAGSVKGTIVTVKPDGDAWNVVLKSGTISQKGGPDLKLDHINIHYQDPVVSFPDGLLLFPAGGNIALGGQVDLKKSLDVTVKITDIPLKPFLPPDMQSKLKGKIFADVKVSGPMPVVSPEVSGSGRLDGGDVEGYPALDFLAKFTHSEKYRKIKLNRASADFVYAGEKVTVSKMVVESRGLVCVEGGFVINKSRINGTFEVGVPHDFVKWLPGLEAKVFTSGRGEYRWATMHVTGPLSSPKEDLSQRIELALATAAVSAVEGVIKDVPKIKNIPAEPKKLLDGLGKSLFK
jgi:hypothetical protein